MATSDSNWLAALALGVGAVMVGSAMSASTKRREFKERLGRSMQERRLGALVNGDVGRDERGVFWRLTIHHPTRGVQAVVVRVGDRDAYSQDAMTFVLERVERWGQRTA